MGGGKVTYAQVIDGYLIICYDPNMADSSILRNKKWNKNLKITINNNVLLLTNPIYKIGVIELWRREANFSNYQVATYFCLLTLGSAFNRSCNFSNRQRLNGSNMMETGFHSYSYHFLSSGSNGSSWS